MNEVKTLVQALGLDDDELFQLLFARGRPSLARAL